MLSIRRSRPLIPTLAFAMALSGCVSNAGWHYQPSEANPQPTHLPLTLAVQNFQDRRPDQNSTYFWLCILPLVPYCTADYDRPDTANGFVSAGAYNFRPSSDLASAAVTELRQSAIFHDVYVTDRSLDPGAQLILHGTITDTRWQGTHYGYLLGPYGPLLWVFGLPVGSVDDTLKLDLQLVRQSDGAALWSYTISGNYEKTESLYHNFGQDFGYPEMFRSGMKTAIASLEQFAASQPAAYWEAMMPPPPASRAR